MGIEEKLESLDSLILAQYEKVNQYCHKRFGTDKYDLAYYVETLAGISVTAMGVYYIISEHLRAGQVPLVGALAIPLGYIVHLVSEKRNHEKREQECAEVLRTGALRAPEPKILRPVELALSGVIAGSGTYLMARTPPAEILMLTPAEILIKHSAAASSIRALGLAIVCGAVCSIGVTSGDYFKSATYTPPTAKKNPVKLFYQSIASLIYKPNILPQEHEYSTREQLNEEGLLA